MDSFVLYPSLYTLPLSMCIDKEFSLNICEQMSDDKKSMKDVLFSFRPKFWHAKKNLLFKPPHLLIYVGLFQILFPLLPLSCSFSNIQSSKIAGVFGRVKEMSMSGTVSSFDFSFWITLSSSPINLFPGKVCVV